ncbi:hypothetical protein NBRC111894_4180 [Sporolactobacillus inulinus]|uniref:Uncharacterized protein n=1 Tax=Sporolactobacillus inulinus TaxID=2078 RepID=A0A4Y1ZHD9_9BACL|nr:hypothetical protein NBRC111894_4180 [Sporolactobacillus inulinus]
MRFFIDPTKLHTTGVSLDYNRFTDMIGGMGVDTSRTR